MLFVSINFSLGKDSVVFSAFVNYNIMLMLCTRIEFSSLRLKCDMGEVFLVLLCKQKGFTGLLEACLSFNKMSPKISGKL